METSLTSGGGSLHVHVDWYGFLGVPCNRGHFDRRTASLFGVSVDVYFKAAADFPLKDIHIQTERICAPMVFYFVHFG